MKDWKRNVMTLNEILKAKREEKGENERRYRREIKKRKKDKKYKTRDDMVGKC